MTSQQKEQLVRLRSEGLSYANIASKLELSENTVKSFYKRNRPENSVPTEITTAINSSCLQCGILIQRRDKVKKRKFCSDACRMLWWKNHPDQVFKKSVYNIICTGCGKEFESYGNKNRKYCSRECFFKIRFGGNNDD